MAKDWYYTKDGERFGPVTAQQLKSIADSSEIQSTDLVWNSEMPDWKTAKSVTGLFETTSQPVVTEPVPPTLPPTGAPSTKPISHSSVTEPFIEWYQKRIGQQHLAIQLMLWVFLGYVWIPMWWLIATGSPPMKTLTAPNGPSRPSAVPFWERKAIIIPSLVVFPLGLFLVWKSSWGNQKKWIYSGACVAFAIFCTVSMQMEKQEAAKKIAEANMFWEQGDQEKAITLYRELEDSLLFNIPKEHRPLMFGRLVDHEAKNGNTEEVRRLIKKASVLFKPDIRSDEAKQIVAQIEAEIEAEKHRPADQDEPNDSQSPVFSEGLAVVLKEGVWCVIDESLKTVGEVGVNSGAEFRPFSNDRAVYSIKVGDEPPDSGGVSVPIIHYGAIDREGKVVIPLEFTRLSNFSDNRAVVWKGTSPEKSGIIDRQGRFILPLTTRYQIGSIGGFDDRLWEVGFTEGLVFFYQNNRGLAGGGFLDTEGRVAIPPEKIRGMTGAFSSAIFSEGLAAIEKGLTEAEERSKFVPADSLKIGYIDKAGEYVIKPQFSQARIFSEGLASVKRRDEKWGYIDKTGQMVIEPQFDWANPFKNGHASVRIDGNEKVIDRTGRIVR